MVKKAKVTTMNNLGYLSLKVTGLVGTPFSVLVHSLFFIGIFGLRFLGVALDSIMLILTTAVSLEAIYLAIFIQMTVNRQEQSLKAVEEDIDEIQEDMEDIQEDVEEIQEGEKEEDLLDRQNREALEGIETNLKKLLNDIENLKRNQIHG